MIKTKYWLSVLAISVVLLTGSLAISPIAVADDDDDDDDDRKKSKTLEQFCTKKKGFDKLICEAIFSIQIMLGMIKDDVAQLQEDVENIQNGAGNSQTYYVAELTVPAGKVLFSETVLCDEGDIATGGGVKVTHPSLGRLLENQFPHTENDVPIGWTMEFWDLDSKVGDTATVYVVCLDNP